MFQENKKNNPHCQELKNKLKEYFFAESENPAFGFILRTNSGEAAFADVLEEAKKLSGQYVTLKDRAAYLKPFTLMYEPLPAYVEALKNLRLSDLEEIVTDDAQIYALMKQHTSAALTGQIRLYEDKLLPLDKLYSLETILTQALQKKVWLKSGGYLVIEQTEALTVIDVNSGKMVKKKEAFLKTNLEAAEELVRQISLRNLSGMILVDFINMKEKKDEEQLIAALKKHLRSDSSGTVYIDMTKLGLVELTRKKNGKTLQEVWK